MADVLANIVRDFLNRVVLEDVLRKANTIYKSIKFDPQDESIRKRPQYTDAGFTANLKLEQAGLEYSDNVQIQTTSR